jgi:hypothetical protein
LVANPCAFFIVYKRCSKPILALDYQFYAPIHLSTHYCRAEGRISINPDFGAEKAPGADESIGREAKLLQLAW